ncbi:hypothetical protein N802_06825 [Knoellia sinensis KCTC 19936]|uniref:NERD domain-containing protein n=1 Tax=Knoellia sinensis KCTC 19936 TaxID=1385520 RepID=A0A0A0J1H2_9MICO|nr:nuclease-related domain-containing protein [Knoellia sinensis]KGN30524.1 hypothetical protein N802_06825 [Knoellia sinensis KCTC 19936]
MAAGGGSADRRAEELAAAGDQGAGAWAAGAEGERRVAVELSGLSEAWTVLHDRLLSPGLSPVNLDHVVLGPGGVLFIDAKNWRGAVTAWQGNLFQHTGAADSRQSVSKHQEVAKVHGMAAYMAAETGLPVTPVICLAGQHEAGFGEPQLIKGVWVVPVSGLKEWLRAQPTTMDRMTVERAAMTLMTSFPSTTTDPQLLSAMGTAAAAKPRRKARRTSSAGPPTRSLAHSTMKPRRVFGQVLRFVVVATFGVAALSFAAQELPDFMAGGLADAVADNSARPVAAPATKAGTPTVAPKPAGKKVPPPAPSKTAVSTCGNLTAAQVGKIVRRTVKPVAVSGSCAWGTRLDDPDTILVTLQTAERAALGSKFDTSAAQRRTVFGSAYVNWKPATGLWVAVGQPIGTGKRPFVATRATHVAIATQELKVSDDRARAMATSIAVAANASS